VTNSPPDTKIGSSQKSIVLHSKVRSVSANLLHNHNGRFSSVRVLIFDLDGTLIDSKEDLVLSVNATLEHMGHPSLPHDVVCSYIGRGAAALIRSSLGPSVTDEQAEEGHEFFLSYYRRHMLDHTVTYPGVREALDALASYKMAVLTNKPVRFSQAILDGLGIARHFQFVFGGNSFEKKKPDPMGAELLLRNFSAKPTEAMMVGDSDVDVLTARNSGVYSCGVSYGLGFESMKAHPPDLMLDTLADLPAHLARPKAAP
jgi:phosphoglycolate phosphatase